MGEVVDLYPGEYREIRKEIRKQMQEQKRQAVIDLPWQISKWLMAVWGLGITAFVIFAVGASLVKTFFH
jgi:hypothetical protein